jgi:hypothetical protein
MVWAIEAPGQSSKHGFEHRDVELSGIGVEARAVIAVGEDQARRQFVHSAVHKREWHATQAERREHGLVGDGAKGEHRAEAGQVGDLGGEKSAAGCDLGGVRFVLRRNATDRVGNTNSAKR